MAAWDFETVWKEHTDTVNPPGDYPTFLISNTIDGSGLCKYLAGGVARQLITSVNGADYLNGQLVGISGDGVVATPAQAVVSGGAVTLSVPAATITLGLLYNWTLQFLPLGGDTKDISQGKERKVFDIVLRVWKSSGGSVGGDSMEEFVIDYSAPENINRNPDDDVLFTGDLHAIGFESKVTNYAQPILTGNQPLPFMLLATIIRSEIIEEK